MQKEKQVIEEIERICKMKFDKPSFKASAILRVIKEYKNEI